MTVADVAASFKRIFTVSSPTAGSFYNGIVGADACLKTPATLRPSARASSSTRRRTRSTIHLIGADPEFQYKLAVPHASILPASSPPKDAGSTPIPTTGPYMVASYDPNRALKLVRNPYFKEWSHDAQPQGYSDEIDRDLRPDRRGRGDRGRERPGRLGLRPAAGRPAQRDRHQVRSPGARQPADGDVVPGR